MELNLDSALPGPAWHEGVQVQTFVVGQVEQATYQVDEEASQDKGYYHHLDFDGLAIRMGMNLEKFDPNSCFLTFHDNDIVGVALNAFNR